MLYTLIQVLKKTVHTLSIVYGHALPAAKEAFLERMNDYTTQLITKLLYK